MEGAAIADGAPTASKRAREAVPVLITKRGRECDVMVSSKNIFGAV